MNHESERVRPGFQKGNPRYPKAKRSEMDAEQAEPQVSTTLIHHHLFLQQTLEALLCARPGAKHWGHIKDMAA